jgi:hypothetical protein
MPMDAPATEHVTDAVLTQILAQLESLQLSHQVLQAKVHLIYPNLPILSNLFEFKLDALSGPQSRTTTIPVPVPGSPPTVPLNGLSGSPPASSSFGISPPSTLLQRTPAPAPAPAVVDREKVLYPQRVILTSESLSYVASRPIIFNSIPRPDRNPTRSSSMGSPRPKTPRSSRSIPPPQLDQTPQRDRCPFRFLLNLSCIGNRLG